MLEFLPPQGFRLLRGGTLVTRGYIKESTYSCNIQSYSQYKKKILICLNRGREESVGNACARRYEMVRMT